MNSCCNLNSFITKQNKKCVTLSHGHLHFQSTLRQKKKNNENSNISPCKNIIFEKYSKSNQNPSIYYNEGHFFSRGGVESVQDLLRVQYLVDCMCYY